MRIFFRPKAQSTIEYVLIITAVVGIIIYAAANWIKPAVTEMLNQSEKAITNASDKLNISG